MERLPIAARVVLLLLCVLPVTGGAVAAQAEDPGYEATVAMLSQTMRPARDGRHHQLLLALRHLRDPELRPLYDILAASPYAPQRVHGVLGQAEISPAERIALATIAEVEDPAERVELLGVSIDDGLLDAATLAQVLSWEGLDDASRLALAVRVAADGVAVNDAILRDALLSETVESPEVGELLRHGLASLLLLQKGDPTARTQLDRLNGLGSERDRDAARAQVLEVGHRHTFDAIGPWALSLAQAPDANPQLRLIALRVALRFLGRGQGPETAEQWESFFTEADGQAQRVRLALVALEASPWSDPGLYRLLVNHDDTYLRRLGEAGRAVAADAPDIDAALVRLVEFGHPLGIQWALRYARDFPGPGRHTVLMAVIVGADQGPARSKSQRMSYAVDAVRVLVEQDAEQALGLLMPILRGPAQQAARGEMSQRHLVLLGLVRSRDAGAASFAEALPEQVDVDARDLSLLLRARWGVAMGTEDWAHAAEAVAGLTSLDESLRLQLGWAYLKHQGRSDEAIREAAARPR